MRLTALVVSGVLLAGPISAQPASPSTNPSTAPANTSTPKAGHDTDAAPRDSSGQPLDLPVSLDRIREALQQPAPEPLRGLNDTAQFRVEVREHQKFEDLLATLNFDSGPPIPGGRYAFEQQQRLFPSVDNPRVQPYAAYTQGELVQVLATSMLQRYYGPRAMNALSAAERARAEAAAKAEVAAAIREFCARQPNGGSGILICDQ